ncbi:MAG: pilus assembly protein TadG-related protein, partial [Pseudomonadota bacterium]
MRSLNMYLNDTRGNVAMVFALTLIPLLAMTGFSIDLTRLSSARTQAQYNLDSAILQGAKSLSDGAAEATAELQVQTVFAAAQSGSDFDVLCQPAQATVTTGTSIISTTVECSLSTTLMQLIGRDQMSFTVTAATDFGVEKIDVAMIFDVSGSMNGGGKLGELKIAAQQAVEDILPGDPTQTDVRIALASYNHQINAGSYFTALTGEN